MTELGFTGTRFGMTPAQKAAVAKRLAAYDPATVVAHHGDCIGADADFHALCRDAGVAKIVAHPGHPDGRPTDTSQRAFTDADEVREPKPFLVRNGDIVDESSEMIATPAEFTETQRGGTWSTIRRARRGGRPLTIVFPDGEVTR